MVKAPTATAVLGTYLSLIPVKAGLAPEASVIEKVSVGRVERGPRGSLRIFKISSPVLVTVATTFKLSTPSTAAGPIPRSGSKSDPACSRALFVTHQRLSKKATG